MWIDFASRVRLDDVVFRLLEKNAPALALEPAMRCAMIVDIAIFGFLCIGSLTKSCCGKWAFSPDKIAERLQSPTDSGKHQA